MTGVVVVDASVALKWVLSEPYSAEATALLATWAQQGTRMLAPSLLAFEAVNALYKRIARGDLAFGDAELGLQELLRLGPVLDQSPDTCIRELQLAQTLGLPAAYDAHYLALAEREHCEYWTADERLWNAVKGTSPWVRWIGEGSA